MWPSALSGRLPIVALVGLYPANWLIGRGPIPYRRNFPHPAMRQLCAYTVLPAVSRCYPPVRGRLSTRYSPVRHSSTGIPSENFLPASSFDLHVLGTPPAFILSQDRTLIKKFQPSSGFSFFESCPARIKLRFILSVYFASSELFLFTIIDCLRKSSGLHCCLFFKDHSVGAPHRPCLTSSVRLTALALVTKHSL